MYRSGELPKIEGERCESVCDSGYEMLSPQPPDQPFRTGNWLMGLFLRLDSKEIRFYDSKAAPEGNSFLKQENRRQALSKRLLVVEKALCNRSI